MKSVRQVRVLCRISRSAFSGERIVHVTLASGEVYDSVAPVRYCRFRSGQEIGRDAPAGDEVIDGLVDGLLVGSDNRTARVTLPNETVSVDSSQLLERKVRVEFESVSIGP